MVRTTNERKSDDELVTYSKVKQLIDFSLEVSGDETEKAFGRLQANIRMLEDKHQAILTRLSGF